MNHAIRAVCCFLILWSLTAIARSAERPHVLWLVAEDCTTTFGCYGDATARTPTIDALAAKGIVFDRCFGEPVCAPSRFTLITGLEAVACGPAHHMRAAGRIPQWLRAFPELLRQAGYHTSNNAKTDYNAPIDVRKAWDQSGNTAHFSGRPDAAQPFFSVFNHMVTHESCLFPEADVPLPFPPTSPATVRVPPYQPDTPEIRADWARHYDHQALFDRQVAERLRQLEAAGLSDDTIVFVFADNGGVLPRSKRCLQQSGTQVPLVVYFPEKWRHLSPAAPGSRIDRPVAFVDFGPTILALAGVPIPDWMRGLPFAGREAARRPREFVFCSRDRMDERYDMSRSVMDSRWLYIRNFRPDLPFVQPLAYMFRARGYQSWAREAEEGRLTPATAQFWGQKPTEELYDMLADPHNLSNLAADPAHDRTRARMRAALRHHAIEVRDNGLLPEGSPWEGYDESRAAAEGLSFDRLFDVALLASDRDPAHKALLLAAVDDPSPPIRWWAAQGLGMLAGRLTPQEADAIRGALAAQLEDPTLAVRVVAAEALVRLNRPSAALPVLERLVGDTDARVALQAANVLERIGAAARPALPAMHAAFEGSTTGPREDGRPTTEFPRYLHALLGRTIDVLEGRAPELVYPEPLGAASTP